MWPIVLPVMLMVTVDPVVTPWVMVTVLLTSPLMGMIWSISLDCLVLVVLTKWFARRTLTDPDPLISFARCRALLTLVTMFRPTLGRLNPVPLV